MALLSDRKEILALTTRVVLRSSSPEDIYLTLWTRERIEAPWESGLCLVPQIPSQFSFTSESLALGSGSLSLSAVYLCGGGEDPLRKDSVRPPSAAIKDTIIAPEFGARVEENGEGALWMSVALPRAVSTRHADQSVRLMGDCLLLVDTHVMGRLLSPLESITIQFH
jgi:hypothetical protein